jgi:hypothetical protein
MQPANSEKKEQTGLIFANPIFTFTQGGTGLQGASAAGKQGTEGQQEGGKK